MPPFKSSRSTIRASDSLRRDLHNRARVVVNHVQLTCSVASERGNDRGPHQGDVIDQVRHKDSARLGVNGERP